MLRQALRWTRRIVLGLVALVTLAVITVVILLHTAWGREQVRSRIEAALDDKLRGDVRIGAVEGTPLGDLTLVDVVITDEAGDEVARIDRAALDVALWSLLDREVELEFLRVDGAIVRGHQQADGSFDLANLIILDDEPLTWDIVIDELTVTNVAVELDRQGQVDHLDGVELRAAVAIRDDAQLVTATAQLAAGWRERGLPVAAAGGVRLDHGVVTVSGVSIDAAGIVVVAPAVRIEGQAVVGAVTAIDPARALAMTAAIVPGRDPGSAVLSIHGLAAGAPVFGLARGDLETQQLRGHLRALGVDAAKLAGVVPPDGLDGPHDLSLDGEVDLRRSRGEVWAVATGPRGDAVTANLAFAFPDAISVRGRLHGRGLAVADAAARDVTIDLDVHGLPARPRGVVHVEGDGVRYDRQLVGAVAIDAATRDDGRIDVAAKLGNRDSRYQLDGTATVTLGDTIEVAIGHHLGVADGVAWSGRGGVVTVSPARATVTGAQLGVAGGHVTIDAVYGRRSGDVAADVVAQRVNLARVARLLGRPPGLRGTADVTAHVARADLAWTGTVAAKGRGVVLERGAEPVDGDVSVTATRGRIALRGHVRGERLGALAVAFDVAPPKDPTDPGAWMRLPREAIRSGEVTLDALDVAALAALAGQPPGPRGRVDGAITMTSSATTGAIQVRGLEVDGGPGPIDAELTLARSQPGVLDLVLDAAVKDVGAARVTAGVDIPTRPFDLDAWRAIDADSVRGVEAKIDDVVLDGELARRMGLDAPWQGHASLAVSVARGLRSAEVTADLLGVRGGPLLRRVDVHVEAKADAHGLVAQVQAGLGGAWLLDARGTVEVSPARLFEDGLAALQRAPVRGTVTMAQADVRRLLRAVGRDQEVDGTVRLDAEVTGTVGAPEGTATIALDDLGIEGASLRSLTIDAAFAGGVAKVKARGHQADGGALVVDGSVPIADLDALEATVVAHDFELAPLAAIGPIQTLGVAGRLDAALALRGFDPATAKVEGTLALHDARLPLGASVGTLRRAEVTASIEGHRVEATASGRIGAGTVDLTATAQLVGLMPTRAAVKLDVEGVTLLAPRRPTVDAHVTADLVRKREQWRVSAEVRDTKVVLSSDPGRVLHDVGTPDDVVFVDDGRPVPSEAAKEVPRQRFGMRPAHPWLVADIKLRRTTVKADELRGQIRGKVTVEVGDDAVAVLGGVDALQGDVVLFDRRYRIDHAQVRFDGTDDPTVDVRLTHAFSQLTLAVNLRGKLSKPELQLTSDPSSYSQGQLLGFLLGAAPGGRPGDETRDAATMIASSLASARVGGFVKRYLPVRLDVLRFEAATATDQASITVGQWLARRLYVGYRRRIDAVPEQNAGQAEVEYWLSPRIVIEGVAGDRGYHDVDLTWVRRW